MMRILQVLLFPLQGSGSGAYVDRLAAVEQARGHTVKVLCCDHSVPQRSYETAALVFKGEAGAAALEADLDFNFPVFTTHPLSPTTTFGSLSETQRAAYVETFRRKIHSEVAGFKPDIIHAHHGWVIGAALADLAVPYVISLHGTEYYGFTHYPAYREMALRGLRQAARVLALTEADRATAIAAYDLKPDRVGVITSGVDTAVFHPVADTTPGPVSTQRPVVLAASKLAPLKGTEVLLRAAAIYAMAPEHPLTLIAGEGSERPRLEALCDELQLRDDVIFLGHQTTAQLVRLYNQAQVTVLASHADWFPLVAIESLACGTPVLATAVGGLPQLVTSNVGHLFSVGDYATLAVHVQHCLRANFKAGARAACVQHVRDQFSWDATVDKTITLYQEVLLENDRVMR